MKQLKTLTLDGGGWKWHFAHDQAVGLVTQLPHITPERLDRVGIRI